MTMIISLMARRVLTLELDEHGPSNIIQWNRFYSCKDYNLPFKPSPDSAPVIRSDSSQIRGNFHFLVRDPALPMINVATSLLSWNPFRKEIANWLKQLDLYDEEISNFTHYQREATEDTLKQVDSDEINSSLGPPLSSEFDFKRQGSKDSV